MSTIFAVDLTPTVGGQVQYPAGRGRFNPSSGSVLGLSRLSTDAIGTFAGTFDGVAAGCEIRVQLEDGTELAGVENCDANHILTWNRYAAGNSNNNVRIKIVAFDYKIKDFPFTTPQSSSGTIPVQQEPDPWASNP